MHTEICSLPLCILGNVMMHLSNPQKNVKFNLLFKIIISNIS